MEKICKLLNQLNFNSLLTLDFERIDTYSFYEYDKKYFRKHPILDFCVSCEQKNINQSTNKKSNFRLQNISHGSHSRDFLDALMADFDTSNWATDGILFLMESPSANDFYQALSSKTNPSYVKRPTTEWYWIHKMMEPKSFPENFRGRAYGGMISSMMLTFRLKNIYLTNLVKCGLNNSEGTQYENLMYYNEACIFNCFNRYLEKEISIINPKIIFTFGSHTERNLRKCLKKSQHKHLLADIVPLPHPAFHSLRGDYFEVIYFHLILKALAQRGIKNKDEVYEIADLFYNES